MNQPEITTFYNQFTSLLPSITSILLMSHKSPDDDSISSMLTLFSFLKHHYPHISVEMKYSGEKDGRWSYFENFDKIQFVEEKELALNSYDMFIGVDASQYMRFVQDTTLFTAYTGKTVFIDHHANPVDKSDLSLVLPGYSSCAQLLHDIFYSKREFSTPRLPETIMLGILGDTGNFRYIKPGQESAFLVAERLVREGHFDVQDLIAQYSGYPERSFLVIKELMRSMQFAEIEGWPRFMYAVLSREFITEHSLNDVDISAGSGIFVGQYGTTIRECSWSMVFSARTHGDVSVSLRSRPGSVNVRKMGQETGWGGGHDRAGGFKFLPENDESIDPHQAVEKVFSWMHEHKPILE